MPHGFPAPAYVCVCALFLHLHPITVLAGAFPGYTAILHGCVHDGTMVVTRNVSAAQCAALCDGAFGCRAFQYVSDRTWTWADQTQGWLWRPRDCELKASDVVGPCTAWDLVAGLDVYVADGTPLSRYVHSPDPVRCVAPALTVQRGVTAAQCAERCEELTECMAFQHLADYAVVPAECWLQGVVPLQVFAEWWGVRTASQPQACIWQGDPPSPELLDRGKNASS